MTTTSTATVEKTFATYGIDDDLCEALAVRGIRHPFPIQELTLPLALGGADIIGQARTGTGKTLAFGLPLLERIDVSSSTTQAMVIVPTRELCVQVAADLTIGAAKGITSIAVYGGVGFDEQIDALTSGVHVVVGTPGRMLDHLNRGNLDLSGVKVVVLDEADEMLDMGFLPDVERLIGGCPDDRQTMLFSATMPQAIVKLGRRFMDTPTFMRADTELHETAPTVEQHFFLVHRMDKPRVLARLLQVEGRGGAFVFTRTKNMADRLVDELAGLGVQAIAVHGDLRQATREKNLDRFRGGRANVLVATEVAARGLDVDNVTHVVNYDCPEDEKMYLHRIGRTARAGSSGVAVTFAEHNEIERMNVIRKALGATSEILEVFSTSPALTELFNLPDDTPWAHLARATGTQRTNGSAGTRNEKRGSNSRSTGSRGGASRGAAASSDGSSSSRGSTSRKQQDSRERRETPPRPRTDDTSATRSADDATATRSADDASRTRTRTRTRESVDTSTPRPSRSRAGSGADATTEQAATKPRPRARRSRGESSSDKGDTGRERAKQASGRGDRATAEGGRKAERSREGGGPRKDGGSRGRTQGGRTQGGRAQGGRSRATGTASGLGPTPAGTRDRHAAKGTEARGAGVPRHERKVEIDHLP